MDTTERQVIDDLFAKIRQAEAGSGPRDGEAESHIASRVKSQPAAPYYMAQAIVIQEQALVAANARIEELQQQLEARPAGGGFLSGLFGGGVAQPARRARPQQMQGYDPRVAQYADPRNRHGGGGFLAGAMQTAMGVAGGLLLGSALMSMFAPDAMAAEEPAAEPAMEEDIGGFDEEF